MSHPRPISSILSFLSRRGSRYFSYTPRRLVAYKNECKRHRTYRNCNDVLWLCLFQTFWRYQGRKVYITVSVNCPLDVDHLRLYRWAAPVAAWLWNSTVLLLPTVLGLTSAAASGTCTNVSFERHNTRNSTQTAIAIVDVVRWPFLSDMVRSRQYAIATQAWDVQLKETDVFSLMERGASLIVIISRLLVRHFTWMIHFWDKLYNLNHPVWATACIPITCFMRFNTSWWDYRGVLEGENCGLSQQSVKVVCYERSMLALTYWQILCSVYYVVDTSQALALLVD